MSDTVNVAIAPSPELLDFVMREISSRQIAPQKPDRERRSEPRRTHAVPVVVQPMDSEVEPLGDPFPAVMREFSLHGLSLVFEDPPRHDLFAVHFVVEGNEYCLFAKIKWRRPVGPFEHVGFRILRQFTTFPKAD